MFDDPKKDLKWLEQQLLAAEADEPEEDDFESLYEEIYEELIQSIRYLLTINYN